MDGVYTGPVLCNYAQLQFMAQIALLVPDRVVGRDGQELGCVLSLDRLPNLEKTSFITNPEYGLQVGIVPLIKGNTKKLHVHPSIKGDNLQKIWLVLKGKVLLKLQDKDKSYQVREVTKDGLVHIVGGPHALEAVEDSVIVLIKQGEGVIPLKKLNNG